MGRTKSAGAAMAALAMLVAAVPAQADTISSAEKLRRLDIMLMVTGLRCRTTSDDFQGDYQDFEAHHLAELNAASRQLRAELARQFGARGADNALDRISVAMANAYGGGHPWLGCHELKGAARDLAAAQGAEPLLAAADAMLSGDAPMQDIVPQLASGDETAPVLVASDAALTSADRPQLAMGGLPRR